MRIRSLSVVRRVVFFKKVLTKWISVIIREISRIYKHYYYDIHANVSAYQKLSAGFQKGTGRRIGGWTA